MASTNHMDPTTMSARDSLTILAVDDDALVLMSDA